VSQLGRLKVISWVRRNFERSAARDWIEGGFARNGFKNMSLQGGKGMAKKETFILLKGKGVFKTVRG
jgi:hypothetical protein